MSTSPTRPSDIQHDDDSLRLNAARTFTACQICREKKVKCSGEQPCQYCLRRELLCVFPKTLRMKSYPVVEVEGLKRKVAFLQRQTNLSTPRLTSTSPKPDGADVTKLSSVMALNDENAGLQVPLISPDLLLSSSQQFGAEVRGIGREPGNYSSKRGQGLTPEDSYGLLQRRRSSEPAGSTDIWPPEEEAYELLDLVLSHIGQSQHLFDPRAFSDRLALFYQDMEMGAQMTSLWLVELLLVLGLGEQIAFGVKRQRGTRSEEDLPGVKYYMEATRRMPDLSIVRGEGILGVEIMGLLALYLQCSDCRADAYTYACTALRLAISHGMYRSNNSKQNLRSERVHCNRLWWSLYMQERRLAAATGHPLSIDDESIDAELPTDAPGFTSSVAININIKIARITGHIMTTVYGTKRGRRSDFIKSVQGILTSLQNIGLTMPSEFGLNFAQTPLRVSRTSASLHLMLFQAIILTIRPILLHLANIKRKEDQSFENANPVLQKLARTCIVTAHKAVTVLQALIQEELLTRFGFFDQDATFSVAFVFILAYTINPRDAISIKGAQQASLVMQDLANHGNKAARKCLAEIQQMCAYLGLHLDTSSSTLNDANSSAVSSNITSDCRSNNTTHTGLYIESNEVEEVPTVPVVPTYDLANIRTSEISTVISGGWILDHIDVPLEDQNDSIYSVYNDPSMTLTGVDFADWAEFDRQIGQW